jgi:hypothetical protein
MTFDLFNHYKGMNDEFRACGGNANFYTPGNLATGCD